MARIDIPMCTLTMWGSDFMRLLPMHLIQALRSVIQRLRRSLVGRAWGRTRDALLQRISPASYSGRVQQETERFDDVTEVNDLPGIFHYWSNKYVLPMFQEYGFQGPVDFFQKQIQLLPMRRPRIISLGAGNCDVEVAIARGLVAAGINEFDFGCLDINRRMLARGLLQARAAGLETHFEFLETDINKWVGVGSYDVVMANQSLHHVVDLEHLFRSIRLVMREHSLLLVSDIVGRNGHMRWPEAMVEVQRFWEELPPNYRYNRQLKRHERKFRDWDCSTVGFEGIRAQDILPLLAKNFHFHTFIAYGNIIDPFVDRSFGPNFSGEGAWDRQFIDRVHARDEHLLLRGGLTPTHIAATLRTVPCDAPKFSRGLSPTSCVRSSDMSGGSSLI